MRKFAVLVARYYINPRDEWVDVNGRMQPQFRTKFVQVSTIEAVDADSALWIAKRNGVVAPVIQAL